MTPWQQVATIAGAILLFVLGLSSIRRAVQSFKEGEFEGTENPSPDVIRRERPVAFWIVMFIHITGGAALILLGFLMILLVAVSGRK